MKHRPARRFGRLFAAVLALTAAATTASTITDPALAQASDSVQCRTTAQIFTVVPDGRLFVWNHNEPETGVPSWQSGPELATGWGPNTWAGPDGRIYTIASNGELHRRRWLNNAWEGDGPGAYTTIGTGFTTYTTAAYRTKFTVDALGHFYHVDPSGFLRWRSYNETTGTWAEAVLDAGWGNYDMIVAAGKGVIYARTTNGYLYRYEYYVGAQRLSGSRSVGGSDWGGFTKLFSPGGDVLYAVRPNGQMLWYRYNPSGGGLVTGSGREVASGGWAVDQATVATTDVCQLTTTNEPQRPTVLADRSAPAALAQTSNGYLQYGYVNTEGRLVHGEIRDLYNVNPNGFAALPGYTGFTGKPTYGENQNGQIRLYAQGTDSDVRGSLQTSPGVWNGMSYFAGRMKTNPQIVRTDNNLVTFVALDDQGYIWTKPQRVLNGSIHAWRRNTYQDPLPVAPAGPLTVHADGNSIELTALGSDGVTYTYWIAAEAEVTLRVPPPPWTSLGNPAGALATGVDLPGGGTIWFTRANDGQVWTKRTDATAWTVLPAATPAGVTAAGAPSAIMAPDGALQVAVRGSDGFVYRTGQANPGSSTWLPWTEITQYEYESAVDPTLSLAADTWVIAFRTPAGDPKLRRFQPTTAAARTADANGNFVEVPLVLAK